MLTSFKIITAAAMLMASTGLYAEQYEYARCEGFAHQGRDMDYECGERREMNERGNYENAVFWMSVSRHHDEKFSVRRSNKCTASSEVRYNPDIIKLNKNDCRYGR